METVLFHNVGDGSISKFSVAVRCGYLLSLRMGVYGKIFWHMTDWELLKKQNLIGKKELLLHRPVPELLVDLHDNFNVLDKLRKVKHLNPQQLILKNKAESNLKILEDRYIRYRLENTQVEHLKFYQSLVHQDENLYLSWLQAEDANQPFSKGSVSWLVDLRGAENLFGPDILWLDADFFKPDFGFRVEWERDLERLSLPTDEPVAVRMISLFRIPQLMLLSETELKYLRKEIAPLTEAWHEAFNPIIGHWMGHNVERPHQKEEWNKVIDLGRQLEKVLENSALVLSQPATRADGLKDFESEVCLGYFPTTVLWDYFRKQQFLSPETQTILENHKNGESHRLFTPAFVIKCPDTLKEQEESETKVVAIRKWIELD